MTTLLPIIEACDNFRISTSPESLHAFYVHVPPQAGDAIIGYLRDSVIAELFKFNQLLSSQAQEPIWDIIDQENKKIVGFSKDLDTPTKRSSAMASMCQAWHETGAPFGDIIAGRLWRNELYPIYRNAFVIKEDEIMFHMERAATPLFGLVTYGVHMTMYTSDYKLWIAKRALTKQTFGGMLDNTVAGGIPLGYTAWDSMVKECMEEGSLPEEVVLPNLKATGAVSYFYQTKKGWLQPEVEFVYDLLVPPGKEQFPEYTPKPLDGEVEQFELLSLDAIREKMLAGEFKPNCALIILDFMIRHGKLNVENEPHFLEILTRMHGSFGYM